MKKITIFLLTFLLLVGFINVNAQKPEVGGPEKIATGLTGSTTGALYCAGTGGTVSNVEVTFIVLTDNMITGTLLNPIIFVTDDNGPREFRPGDPEFNSISATNFSSFWFVGDIEGTATFTATIQTPTTTFPLPGYEFEIVVGVIPAPTVTLDPATLTGIMCEGGSITLEGEVTWPEASTIYPPSIEFTWNDGVAGPGTPQTYNLGTPETNTFSSLTPNDYDFTFAITVTDYYGNHAVGCDASANIPFTVVNDPTVALAADTTTVCVDYGQIEFTATGTFTSTETYEYIYTLYDGNDNYISNISNTVTGAVPTQHFIVNVSDMVVGTNDFYVVLEINNVGTGDVTSACEGTSNIETITIYALPVAILSYPDSVCAQGDPIAPTLTTVFANGGGNVTTISFTINPPTGLTIDPSTGELTVAGAQEGVYEITWTFEDIYCMNDTTFEITILPLPIVDFNILANPVRAPFMNVLYPWVCEETSAFVLTGGTPVPTMPEQTGVYEGPGVSFDGTDYIFDPTGLAIFNVAVDEVKHQIWYIFTDEFGCTDSAWQYICVYPIPRVALAYPDSVCPDAGLVAPTLPFATPPSPAGTFRHITENRFNVTKQFSISPALPIDANGVINFTDAAPGKYVVTVTYNNWYCENFSVDSIIVRERPTVTITPNPAIACRNSGDLQIAAIPDGNGPFSNYNWSNPDMVILTGAVGTPDSLYNISTVVALPINVIVYDTIGVTVEDKYGCVSLPAIAPIRIDTIPVVTFTLNPDTICINTPGFPLNMATPAGGIYSGPGVMSGSLTGTGPFAFSPTAAGIGQHRLYYTYTTPGPNGCTNVDSADIWVRDLPTSALNYNGGQTAFCAIGKTGVPALDAGMTATSFAIIPDGTPSYIDPLTGVLTLDSMPARAYQVVYKFTDGYCENVDTLDITVNAQPRLTAINPGPKTCPGQPITLSVGVTPSTPVTWYNTATWTSVGTALTLGPPSSPAAPAFGSSDNYAVVALNATTGCTDTARITVNGIQPPITLTLNPVPATVCDNTNINLGATIVTHQAGTTQTYAWYMSTNGGTTWTATGVNTQNGRYLLALNGATSVMFQLRVATNNYTCPVVLTTPAIAVIPSIEALPAGTANDTVCHGGSTDVTFALSNFNMDEPVYYRWYENGPYYEGANEIHVLPAGVTDITFTTRPSLHENQNGPESYCYFVEVWQAPVVTPGTIPVPNGTFCTSFSPCYMVTVLKDPILTISGPVYVPHRANDFPVFRANAVGGTGNETFEWYVDGVLVPGADSAVLIMNNTNVLNTIGAHDVAVRVAQNYSGCEAQLVVHQFYVIYGCAEVEIRGPREGCVGDVITLTAIVNVHEQMDYTLQWKMEDVNGVDYIVGATGQTYEFVVGPNVDRVGFYIELNCGGCDVVKSEVHYFQVLPKPHVAVDDYIICENGAIEVVAEVTTFDPTQVIYRYIWYDAAGNQIDITYTNRKFFRYNEVMATTDGLFYVGVQMLNSVCSPDTVPFTIEVQGKLNPIAITATPTEICVNNLAYFELDVDSANVADHGAAIITWWIDGFPVNSPNVPYLNPAFDVVGTHYVEAHVRYENYTCEILSERITIEVYPNPSVVIAGPTLICNTANAVDLYAIVDPSNLNLTYKWYLDGDSIGNAERQAANTTASYLPYSYHVEVTTVEAGCFGQSPVHYIMVEEFPTVGITADKLKVCAGEVVTLEANIIGVVTGDPNMRYQWYANNVEIPGQIYPVLHRIVNTTTTYSFKVRQLGSDCVAESNSITITVVTVPAITIAVDPANTTAICEGGSVMLTATPNIPGATYTWYANGTVIPGAVLNSIVHFPTTINGNVTDYRYTAVAVLDPGCMSSISNVVTVTVNPPLNVIVEGPNVICEGATLQLTGIVTNYDPATGPLLYTWSLPNVAGQPADPTDYLEGFGDGFATLNPALPNVYASNYPADPIIPGFNTTYTFTQFPATVGVIPCGSMTGTSLREMYTDGMIDAAELGNADGIAATDAANQAATFITGITAAIQADAATAAASDAAFASSAIYYAQGLAQGELRAQDIANLYVQRVIDGTMLQINDVITMGDAPAPASFVPACISTVRNSQINAYKEGYVYEYKNIYATAYYEAYIEAVTNAIIDIYTAKYATAFDAAYNLIGYYTTQTAPDGNNAPLTMDNLTARDYPYNFYLTVSNRHGCIATVLHQVTVENAAIAIDSITYSPSLNICNGGQVTLTAHTAADTAVYYYMWYENGILIPGQNMATILVSPVTVDNDRTTFVYNAIAVRAGNEHCVARVNPLRAITINVKRNPIIEIHGIQTVCDIYNGEAEFAEPNIEIIGYVDGNYQTWHCYNANPNDPNHPRNTWRHYQWYLDGALYYPENFCDAQRLNIYLPARQQAYKFKMEYDAGLGCSGWSQEFEVRVHAQQVVNITSNEDTICEGGRVTLTANLNDYNETDYVFQWYKDVYLPEGLIPGATRIDYHTPAVNEQGNVTYFVEVKQNTTYNPQDTLSKCLVVAEYTLFVVSTSSIDSITIDKDFVCTGGQVTVTAYLNPANYGRNPIYRWTRNNAEIVGVTGPTFTESLYATNADGVTYTYNVTVTYGASGCRSVENPALAQTVTVYSLPNVVIDGNAHFCEGDYVYLQANVTNIPEDATFTYQWFQSGEPRDNERIGDPHSKFYAERWAPRHNPYYFTVMVTRGNGCTSPMSAPFEVFVDHAPIVNITASENPVCEGGTTTLTANLDDYTTDHITYQWYKLSYEVDSIPVGEELFREFIDTIENRILGATERQYITEPLTETTTYVVVVRQTSSRCLAVNFITIDVTPKPVIVFDTVSEQICNGEQVPMSVTTTIDGETVPDADLNYQWFVNGVAIRGAITNSYTHTATASGTYNYEVQAFYPASGCTSLRTLVGTIIIDNPVTVEIAGNTLICQGAAGATLHAITTPPNATVDYLWYLNGNPIVIRIDTVETEAGDTYVPVYATGATLDISTLVATYAIYNFTVRVTTPGSGCSFLSPIHPVYVDQFPVIGIDVDPTLVCAGDRVDLNARIGNEPNMTYAWYANDVVISNAPNCIHYPVVTTTYRFEAIQAGSACTAQSGTVVVTVDQLPVLTVTPDTATICRYTQRTFTASAPNAVTYNWFINGTRMNGITGSQFTHNFDIVGTYRVEVSATSPAGCTSGTKLVGFITVKNGPTVEIEGPHVVCYGEEYIRLHALVTPPNTAITYQWYEGMIAKGTERSQLINDAPGTYNYRVYVTDTESGCVANSLWYTVEVGVIPTVPTLTMTPQAGKICSGSQVIITGDVAGTYTWYRNGQIFAENALNRIVDEPTATNAIISYTYTAKVTTADGCTSEPSTGVTVAVHPPLQSVTLTGAHEVCAQTGVPHMFLQAVLYSEQPGVTYRYTLWYLQGPNRVKIADYYEPNFIAVPDTLPANDMAAPYVFFVEVTADEYGCTAQSNTHNVNIYTKPTVQIAVTPATICLGGTIEANAFVTPTPTPENPYNYVWTVTTSGGTVITLPDNAPTVSITPPAIGINTIAVTVTRAYGSLSCTGTNSIEVNVVAPPVLTAANLTQNYTGMCVGGEISLCVQNVTVSLINPSFTYEWRRVGGGEIPTTSACHREVLTIPGEYRYEVKANGTLGCNSNWVAFAPIRVVAQPTLTIASNDAHYDICKEKAVTINVNLNITDPTILQVNSYCWSDDVCGTGPITSRNITFTNPGTYPYSLEMDFVNPTCRAITSNEIRFNVVESPKWANLDVNPKWSLCLRGVVDLKAEFLQGTTNNINIGTIQWEYSTNNGATWTGEPDIYVGGNKTHIPATTGDYKYRVNYIPSNPATGCALAPVVFGPVHVLGIPTAQFVEAAAGNSPLTVCKGDLNNVELKIEFTGIPPYQFRVEGPNGYSINQTTSQSIYSLMVPPVPGTYKVTLMKDNSICPAELFLYTEIQIVITDVVVPSYVKVCGSTAVIPVVVTTLASNIAKITGDITDQVEIINNTITLTNPVTAGVYNIIVTIDACQYPVALHVGNPIEGLSAKFVDAPTLQVCETPPGPVALKIEFTGVPRFDFVIAANGVHLPAQTSNEMEITVMVFPTVTTLYTIESLSNDIGCDVIDEINKPKILVTIGDVEIVTNVVAACDGNVAYVEVNTTFPGEAVIVFGTTTQTVLINQGHNIIPVIIPAGTQAGVHTITITIGKCTYDVLVVYSGNATNGNSLIHRRWEGNADVLVVSNNFCDKTSPYYNGGIEFTSYQWYKNGVEIQGATQQYYQDPAGVNGEYAVRLTGFLVEVNGETCEITKRGARVEFTSCEQSFLPSTSINVYPVPAKVNQTITVELNLTPAELENAILDIYDAKGAHVQHIRVTDRITKVDGFKAQGTYFGKIVTGTNEIKAVKFVIVK